MPSGSADVRERWHGTRLGMCHRAGSSQRPRPHIGPCQVPAVPKPRLGSDVRGWAAARRWERGRKIFVGLGAWEWDSTWGTARGRCPLPGCAVGRSQGLRGQDEPRREGSAARRSVRGCKQLDPANEASLSKDVSCARAQHRAAPLSCPCWEGTHTHTHTHLAGGGTAVGRRGRAGRRAGLGAKPCRQRAGGGRRAAATARDPAVPMKPGTHGAGQPGPPGCSHGQPGPPRPRQQVSGVVRAGSGGAAARGRGGGGRASAVPCRRGSPGCSVPALGGWRMATGL